MHRRGRLCSIHDDSKRGDRSNHAYHATTAGVEIETRILGKARSDRNFTTRNHVGRSGLIIQHPQPKDYDS